MKNWTVCLNCLGRFLSLFLLLCFSSYHVSVAQISDFGSEPAFSQFRYQNTGNLFLTDTTNVTDEGQGNTFPDPRSVMYSSMIVPGWGQIRNRQIWKVPIIYGLLGGLAWYSVQLTKDYHDFRAAYYNLNPETPEDMRFGPTPGYIPENTSLESLRNTRNALRNRRDKVYLGLVLAYGLNIVDAYVFAHMRSFDVSDDLSMRTTLQPSMVAQGGPGVTLSIELFNKSKTR